MDRQLLERLIGAGVLVVAFVIVVPAILDGDLADEAEHESGTPAILNEPRRTHTIRLDQSTERPPVAREVAESAPDPEPLISTSGSGSVTVAAQQPVKPVAAKPRSEPKPVAVAKPKSSSASAARRTALTAVPPSGWVVQLGSFSSRQNAQRLADEVSGRGFSVFLMPLDRSGKKLYRVRVGPRDTRAQAAELAGDLAKIGYSGQVAQQRPDA